MLSSERQTAKEFWLVVKPLAREMESDDGVIIIDESIELTLHGEVLKLNRFKSSQFFKSSLQSGNVYL
jgi:hypothetical protein